MFPVCRPVNVAVGVKVTLSVHDAPAAKEVPHPVAANSALLLVRATDIVAVVLFFTVKVLAALVTPSTTLPNAREAGVMVIGVTPVPVRVEALGLPVPV